MREILFHGKRADNGEWVEGILFNAEEDTFIIPHGNEYSYDPMEGLAFDVYGCKVAPETVGQYTGLTDKNGKRIFEGDIVNVIYTSSLGEEFTQITTVRYDETECCFYPMRWEEYCVNCDYSTEIIEIIVISNIHDSPKLLGEEENESDSR